MTVAEAKQRISTDEFFRWIAYDRTQPFGEHVQDFRAAIGAWTTAHCHGNKMPIDDFFPVPPPKRVQSPEEMFALLRGMGFKAR